MHLESEDNHKVRVEQLREIRAILERWRAQGVTDSLLMGDFNFCSYRCAPSYPPCTAGTCSVRLPHGSMRCLHWPCRNYAKRRNTVLQEQPHLPPTAPTGTLQNHCLSQILPNHIDVWPYLHQPHGSLSHGLLGECLGSLPLSASLRSPHPHDRTILTR